MFLLLFSLARILGIELYGVFSYHYAIITGIAAVAGESLSVALSRYVVLNSKNISYKTSLNLMVWGGLVVGLLSVIISWTFPAPASSYDAIDGYMMLGTFLLGFACVCNLAVTGFMYALNTSKKWAIVLAAHGLLGLLLVVAVAKFEGQIETVVLALALCTLIAPAFGFSMIKNSDTNTSLEAGWGFFSFREMWALLSRSGVPALAGSMLLGGPVHIVCLMMFADASLNVSEVGYFNIFFLFYILVTVLPSALASYVIVRLAGYGDGAGRLYLLFGALVSVVLPVLMVVSQDYWLCLLGDGFCGKRELLEYAALAGGAGLMTTIITQVLHSKNMTRVVFLASCLYAVVYLFSTLLASLKGEMLATDLFSSFLFALAAQITVLIVLGARRLLK
ncbi:hypothetical protein SAMN05444352_11553 [Pseudomonas japonica]|uniref:Membrane protein involved in the export of O-antigen and teichoic acid n=2 Tax=Pseudomonas japonica TaxID=256466 RepID=A0A239HDS5_9PSED|nr:hypothetical protein SAMN05444352_11553 [Pseudomonas japonica]